MATWVHSGRAQFQLHGVVEGVDTGAQFGQLVRLCVLGAEAGPLRCSSPAAATISAAGELIAAASLEAPIRPGKRLWVLAWQRQGHGRIPTLNAATDTTLRGAERQPRCGGRL